MKKLIFSFVAIALSTAIYSFTTGSNVKAKPLATYFYQYTGSGTTQTDIQNISNYARASESCGGSEDVCGVYLTTDRPLGQQPVSTEFDAVKSDLRDSQQNHESVDETIIAMKN